MTSFVGYVLAYWGFGGFHVFGFGKFLWKMTVGDNWGDLAGGLLSAVLGGVSARAMPQKSWLWVLWVVGPLCVWWGANVQNRVEWVEAVLPARELPSLAGVPSPEAALAGFLADDNPVVRSEACLVLAETKSSLVKPLLFAAAHDPDTGVRHCAVKGLAKSKWLGAQGVCLRLVSDPDMWVRIEALKGLSNFPSAISIRAVSEAVADREWMVRSDALTALRDMGTAAAAEALGEFLTHPSGVIRQEAAEALTKIPHPDGVLRRLIVAALGDSNPRVRARAVLALKKRLTDRTAVAVFPLLKDPVAWVRLRAVMALSDIRTPRVRRELAKLLSDPHPVVSAAAAQALGEGEPRALARVFQAGALKDPDASLRLDSLWLLAQIHSPVALETLGSFALTKEDSGSAASAAFATGHVGEMRQREALSWLLRILRESPSEWARAEAAKALGERRQEGVAAALGRALCEDPHYAVQDEVATALSRQRSRESEAALLSALRMKDTLGRLTVLRALGEVGGRYATSALLRLAASDRYYAPFAKLAMVQIALRQASAREGRLASTSSSAP